MSCLHCHVERAMRCARPGEQLTGSMYRLCPGCAFKLMPTSREAYLAVAKYRYPQFKITPAQVDAQLDAILAGHRL